MLKYNNIINRSGGKENDINFFQHLLPLDVDAVVEPFGGSVAVVKHFHKDINKCLGAPLAPTFRYFRTLASKPTLEPFHFCFYTVAVCNSYREGILPIRMESSLSFLYSCYIQFI